MGNSGKLWVIRPYRVVLFRCHIASMFPYKNDMDAHCGECGRVSMDAHAFHRRMKFIRITNQQLASIL